MDVKSIAKMYMLRADQRPVRIQDCSYLFVTSNRSLCCNFKSFVVYDSK